MVQIKGEIVIKRSVDEVFDFVADERNEPAYNPHMIRVEQLSPGPIGLGTRFQAETRMRRSTVEMVIEWTAYDRPRLLASATHLSTMEIAGTLTFEAVPGGTLMRWVWELKPRGLAKLMTPLVARMGRKQEQANCASLKRHLEGAANPQPRT